MKITGKGLALVAAAMLVVAGCGGGATASPVNDHVLRIAMGSPGEAQIRVWDGVAADYMAAHPETKVEINYQQDDLYQTIGLQNLLNGKNPPDIYFEWTGERMRLRNQDGFAADISAAFKDGGTLAGIWDDAVLGPYTIDGKVVGVPYAADVTNVLWYNKQIFLENGLKAPATWDELLAVCDALDAKGIIPIASGNKDLWAGGNWLAHQTSRVVGEESYNAVLGGTGKFDTPEWQKAFGYIDQLREHKCVNESANAVDDNAGAQLFFQGKAAMHAIGSWLVSWAIDEAPDLDFDYVNIPPMPDGKGNGESVIGVGTGYMINAQSAKQKEALEFMALLNSPENVARFIEAEVTPLAKAASEGAELDARTTALNDMLNSAPAVVLPPDTGYDLKMADAFYTAIAEVLGGQATPQEALAGIDEKLGRK